MWNARLWLIVVGFIACSTSRDVARGGSPDDASFLPGFPSLTFTDPGERGAWTPGMPVTLRWRQQRLAGTEVHVEVSRDRGGTWGEIGIAPTESERFTWWVRGHWGPALVRLACSGWRTRNQVRRVVFTPPVKSISFGVSFGIALHEDGRVRAWGALNWSPLPGLQGGVLARPKVLRQFSHVAAIHAGGNTAVMVEEDGSAWLWRPRVRAEPFRITGAGHAIWARTHYRATFVRIDDGRVLAFGTDDPGPDADSTREAVEIPDLRDVMDIQLGDDHGAALRPDGTVLTWGSNFFGQLGDGSGISRSDPEPVPGLTNVVAISARLETTLALTTDGAVWIWGRAYELIPSTQNYGSALTPYRIAGLERIVEIGCGEASGYALRDDGVVMAWGTNGSGELGNGTYFARRTPGPTLMQDASRMFVGEGCVHVLTSDGMRLGWGGRQFHQVGDGTSDNQPVPVRIYSR